MGSSEYAGYCSFTQAIEHLGDRWILLIVRQLATQGTCGFNDLANGLPGRISRSVLIDRLHRLEALGLVARSDDGTAGYRLMREHLPERTTVVEIRLAHGSAQRYWLVLQRDEEPYGCLKDPFLDPSRYLYVEAPATTLLSLARGRYSWATALDEGAISVDGDPRLRKLLSEWFDVEADAPVPVQQG